MHGKGHWMLAVATAAAMSLARDARGDWPAVVERASRSVVRVEAGAGRSGTGWVFDPAGRVVASAALVRGARSVSVIPEDGRRLAARVLGTEDALDLALLEVPVRLGALALGRPDLARVGEAIGVLARGAGGPRFSAAWLGARGGLGRPLLDDDLIPDREIGSEAIGAPMLDGAGRVLGTCAARAGRPGVVGVPIDVIGVAARQIVERGSVEWPWLGLALAEIGPEEAGRRAAPAGARIEVALADRSSQAGVAAGDVLVAIEGRRVRSVGEVQRIVLAHRVGQRLRLELSRGGQPLSVELALERRPPGPP